VPPKIPPRFSLNTDLTLGVNAQISIHYFLEVLNFFRNYYVFQKNEIFWNENIESSRIFNFSK
jgi:hypothetical protein